MAHCFAKTHLDKSQLNKRPECFLPFAGNIPVLQMHAFGMIKEGPESGAFCRGRAATGLQPGYEKKSFVGSQMLVSSDSIYVKTGL